MKKDILFYIYIFITLLVIITNSVFLIKDNFFINIESVPEGVYSGSSVSPDGKTELKVYKIELPVGNSVRVAEVKDNIKRNIFWQTGTEKAKIKWKSKNIVVINGIELDLKEKEFFDSRSISSIFNDGKMGR